jgi:hypothetical protein
MEIDLWQRLNMLEAKIDIILKKVAPESIKEEKDEKS